MRRIALAGALAVTLGLATADRGLAYDFAHSPYGNLGCDYCHFVYLDQLLPDQVPHTPLDLDDTVVNNLCRSCHNGVSAVYVQPHSSLTTSELHGSWNVECTECHSPHAKYEHYGSCTSADTSTLTAAGAGWTPDEFAGLQLVPNVNKPDYRYTILGNTADVLTVEGPIDLAQVQPGDSFGIFLRKLVHKTIATPNSGHKAVKYLASTGANSQADGDGVYDGICEVCHTQTSHFRNDGSAPDQLHENVQAGGLSGDECVRCHTHANGFAHGAGSGQNCGTCHGGTGAHTQHLAGVSADCGNCHNPLDFPYFKSGTDTGDGHIDLAETNVCENCHHDGTGGSANHTGFKAGWTGGLDLGCDGCHNGRSELDAVEMATNGHHRLVGSEWIRKYPCHYCHSESVDESWNLLDKHTNGTADVAVAARWQIDGMAPSSYDQPTMICSNVYCHSDGTTETPRVSAISWDDPTHLGCNSCHGHPITDCTDCHAEGVAEWSSEDNWKSSMPMYTNGGPGTGTANTHNRHLMTDFSCENCHVDTVVGSCGDCHSAGIPPGQMGEVGHVNAAFHVNGDRDIKFATTGSYEKTTKTCSTTECHVGSDPVWGDDVAGQIICLSCHGTTEADVDDYQAFNGTRGRINLTEWFTTGHGRAAVSGNYKSGNPPANFPGNPCWYCHDFDVLHQDPTNPYRLKMHAEFDDHFEKQCVYCHMEQKDPECLICHNDPTSLSPQLAALTDPPYSQDHSGYTDGLTTCLSGGCHPDDASQHNHGAGVWSAAEKNDIRIQYRMMGVCLKCHDEDRFEVVCTDPGGSGPDCATCHNGVDPRERCQECHTGPQYVLGYDPGTGLIEGVSRASTSHFGYKHYKAFKDSLLPPLATGTASETATGNMTLRDASQSWTIDQWAGDSVQMTGGADDGEIRVIASNTADTLTLTAPLLNPVAQTNPYAIVDVVWKGGKFCWDCHDPHGDSNVFMIHDKVALETDGTFGQPVALAPVSFTNLQSGLDYARTAGPYNGICNVCHTDTEHYTSVTGDGHMAGRVCTTCHSHRFGTSHASGKTCNSCHQAKPLTRHEGLGQPRDCTQCHEGAIKLRMDIMGQMRANSHHVQDVEVSNTHCYACHWESTPEGLVDPDYHEGFNSRDHTAVPNEKVDLVVWGPGTRPSVPVEGADPAVYEPGDTLVRFTANQIGTGNERAEVSKVTEHCLSCHSDQNNDTEPFDDCKTPRQYAWDRSSVGARYSDAGTANWGKYSGMPNAARKNMYKAYSAHGNASANGGGWSAITGVDGTISNTRAGLQNVQCFDCHSSHGSKTAGTTSSYTTFNNTNNGANLKETQAGKGGYGVTYRAQEVTGGVNPMKAGAAQCFDCHETQTAGALPWGYNSTYGATQAIMGYKDTPRFGNGLKGSALRYPYRQGNAMLGGHLAASSPLATGAQFPINGLCAGCHDPHGVSPSLGDDRAYALPLLKGTWLTSPYKEDTATASWGIDAYYKRAGWGPPPVGYHLDQDTFGSGNWITESEEQFAGLCLRCHPKASLTDVTQKNTSWKSVDRLHETVKGWGSNEVHNYPCSKCHQAHVSALPRLMQTNCMDVKHQGQVDQGGSFPPYVGNYRQFSTSYGGRPPQGWRTPRLTNCHEAGDAGGGTWSYSPSWNPLVQQWNSVTPW